MNTIRLRRAFAIVLALVAVVLGGAVVSGFQLYGDTLSEQEQQSLENTASTSAGQIDGLIDERSRTVELQASDPVVLGSDEPRRTELQLFVQKTQYQGVSVIRADGEMVAIESEELSEENRSGIIGEDFSDRTYFQEAMNGETYISEPVEAETGNLIIIVSTPIERDGEFVGTLNGALHIDDSSFFDTLLSADDTDHSLQVSAGETVLYRTDEYEQRDQSTVATVEATGWEVTAFQRATGNGQTQVATILQFGAGAMVLVTLIGFGAWFQRSNLRQIEELLAGFDRLAAREYGTRISVGGAQEWDEIEGRFNEVSEELALHERELKRYREIVERVDDPIRLQDREGNHKLVNQAVSEFSGYPREEILGADESLYLDEESTAFLEEKRAEVIEKGEPLEYDVSVCFERTGREATFSTRLYPYYDEDGELSGTLAVCRDITRLKDRERELRQYERAVDGATDLICAIDQDREYLFANPQYCAYHGIDEETLSDTETSDVFDDRTYEEINEYTERALNGEAVKYKMTRIHPSRGERILDVRYYPLGDDAEVTGIVAVLRDVTQREERARQLRVVDRVLRHNLRNDLTVIRLEAERIKAGASGPLSESAEAVLEHTEDLLTTSDKSRSITDVLSDQPDRRPTELKPLIENICTELEESHSETTIDVTTANEVTVSASSYLHDAIEELVINAILHSNRDEPSISLTVENRDKQVSVRVADDGPGIPKMDRDVLETGRPIEDLYHGSGLGLWLVYWIVQRSGGTISIQDRQPRGTVIEILLPGADE